MDKIASCLAIVIFLAFVLSSNHSHSAEILIGEWNFESPDSLREWNVSGENISVVKRHDGKGSCIKIISEKRRGWAVISRELRNYTGTLKLQAWIQCKDIVRGDKRWDRGKFQAVVQVPGKEDVFIGDDFHEDSAFALREFRVMDLTGEETILLRIGLQNAKGTVWVDDIKVFLEP